jgi:hypothetical protein
MAIKGPKGAVPTSIGWVGKKGELLKSQRISAEQIAEWHGEHSPAPVVEAPVVQTLHEAPVVESLLEEEELDHFYGEEPEEDEEE